MAGRVKALGLGQLQDLKLLLAVLSEILKPDRDGWAHQHGRAHFLIFSSPPSKPQPQVWHLPGSLSHIALVHELLGEQQTLLKIRTQSDSRAHSRTVEVGI